MALEDNVCTTTWRRGYDSIREVERCEKPCPSCTTPIGAKRLVYEHASCLFTKYYLFLDIGRYSIVAFRLPLRCEDF